MNLLRESIGDLSDNLTTFIVGMQTWCRYVECQLPSSRHFKTTADIAKGGITTPAESVITDNNHTLNSGSKERVGFQGNHTTPAQNLLDEWDTMGTFPIGVEYLDNLRDKGCRYSEYPMQLEQGRGLLQERLGLGLDARPNFSIAGVDDLHMLYMKHIHALHPFLDCYELQRMMKEFKEQYSLDERDANTAATAALHSNPGTKRKRSSYGLGESFSHIGAIEHTLRNAIVLLVLALGQVCSFKAPLPCPQSDRGVHTNEIWGSSNSKSHSMVNTCSKNIDIPPGMACFSYAIDIMGSRQGGNTVEHAQAMILIALYIGQYARVLESWSWVQSACRVAMVLVIQ